MLDNRALVDNILTRRGVAAADRERVCGDSVAVESLANAITKSLNPEPIDIALREYWEDQKADDPSDDGQDEE